MNRSLKPRETGYQKFLTKAEWQKCHNYVYTRLKTAPTTQACFFTIMFTGLRVSEACSLKRENFNKDFSILNYSLLKTKGRIHTISIPSQLQTLLQIYFVKYSKHFRDGYMFPPYQNQSNNSHITRTTMLVWVKRMREATGITDFYYTKKCGKRLYRLSCHTFRHFACWRYYKSSGNCIKTVQEMIGHKRPDTTAIYIKALRNREQDYSIRSNAFAFA